MVDIQPIRSQYLGHVITEEEGGEMDDVRQCLCCDMQCVATTGGLPLSMSPDNVL